jgi:hypothetical protein
VNFAKTAYILQGRYFLPVALGFLLVTCHGVRVLRRAFIVVLVAFNLYAMHLSTVRYYAGDWSAIWRALPFAASPRS